MAYIWRFRAGHPWSWTGVLAIILLSHYIRGDRPAELGCRAQGFNACLRRYGLLIAAIVALFLGVAFEEGTLRHMTMGGIALGLALYIPWGFFQQYLLNGYLLNRLESALSPMKASFLAAGLFCLAHLPNWFLMITTLVFGVAANVVYRRHKNLYFLGLAHAVIGFTIFIATPDWMIHHLRIGPGWFGQ
jgi:membrane protease YdiL (CAAX protease family)